MGLLKVFDYAKGSRMVWNYYPNDDLLVYSFGGTHSDIENEVGTENMPVGGNVLDELTQRILLKFEKDELSEEQKSKLFRQLGVLFEAEGIRINPYCAIGFLDSSLSLDEILELRRKE